jgi:Transposase DDE domain
METIKLWARNRAAVTQALELGEIVQVETASEELTDEFLLFALQSGLLQKWATGFPDPRPQPEIPLTVILAASLAARFAGLYSLRKTGYVLRSARVLGELGYSVEVLEAEAGLSAKGTSDDKLFSGDVIRKLLGKLEAQSAAVAPPADAAPPAVSVPARQVRPRLSRREVKAEVEWSTAEAQARGAATRLCAWYNTTVAPSLLAQADLGAGRRLHILDATWIEVALEAANYELSGVVRDDAGQLHRGYKLGTLRTLLDTAGVLTQVAVGPIQMHDLALCRELLWESSVLRAGDLLLEDRGFLDGATTTYLKRERGVEVIFPLKSTMESYREAVQLAQMAGQWQPHPTRSGQEIALVKGVAHVWDQCAVELNAGVIRFYNKKKQQWDYIVLVTTDLSLSAAWIVKHYQERPEIEQDYQQMKSGGWKLEKLSSTRYSEIVFYVLMVALSYSLYHLFSNTKAGARFADKTRAALAFEQLRTRRTHVIVYVATGYFEIFETLSFVQLILQLPPHIQARLKDWFDQQLPSG